MIIKLRTYDPKAEVYSEQATAKAACQAEGENGARVILNHGGRYEPDIYIERQPDRWVVLTHPDDGADPVAVTYINDDGTVTHEDTD